MNLQSFSHQQPQNHAAQKLYEALIQVGLRPQRLQKEVPLHVP